MGFRIPMGPLFYCLIFFWGRGGGGGGRGPELCVPERAGALNFLSRVEVP